MPMETKLLTEGKKTEISIFDSPPFCAQFNSIFMW